MKAVLLMSHGGPEMLRYGDAPDPTAGSGEVVVDIHAASVNAADYKVRLGSGRSNLRFPYILGRDFSGVAAVFSAASALSSTAFFHWMAPSSLSSPVVCMSKSVNVKKIATKIRSSREQERVEAILVLEVHEERDHQRGLVNATTASRPAGSPSRVRRTRPRRSGSSGTAAMMNTAVNCQTGLTWW